MSDKPAFVAPLAEPAEIATPRASASIVVVRDRADLLEIFMLERHLKADFAGGAYVFPGGTLDASDADPALDEVTDWPDDLLGQMGEQDEQAARALAMCAIRETFEEAGVLLARREGEPVRLDGEDWPTLRRAVAARELTPLDLARRTGIRYAADLLRFWARWVTPTHSPRRYDTRFFVAFVPPAQRPLHDDVETTASRWISPPEALEQARAGRFSIIFPTRKMLESLAPHRSAHELYDAAIGRPTDPILPRVVVVDGAAKIQLPGDATLHEP